MKHKLLTGLISIAVSASAFAEGDFTSTITQDGTNTNSVVTISQGNDDDFASTAVSTASVEQLSGSNSTATINQFNVDGSGVTIVQEGDDHQLTANQTDKVNDHIDARQAGSGQTANIEKLGHGTGIARVIVDQSGSLNTTNIYQANYTADTDEISLTQSGTSNYAYVDQWGRNDNNGSRTFVIAQDGDNNQFDGHQHYSNNSVATYSQVGSGNKSHIHQNAAVDSIATVSVSGDNNDLYSVQGTATNDQLLITILGSDNTVETRQGDGANPSSLSSISYTATGDNNQAAISQYGAGHSYTAVQDGDFGNITVCQGLSTNTNCSGG